MNPKIKIVKKLSTRKSICECVECGAHYEADHFDVKRSHIGHLCILCKKPANQVLDQSLVKKFFNYDPLTGELTRRLPTSNNYVGEVVGTLKGKGYLSVGFGNKHYLVHRLIWLYMTGHLPDQVDHINHNGLDPLLSEDQVILLIQSSSVIGLPELSYLAAALHQENKQNKL